VTVQPAGAAGELQRGERHFHGRPRLGAWGSRPMRPAFDRT
jgi:hypothetical protein